jgi:hypothetical protein
MSHKRFRSHPGMEKGAVKPSSDSRQHKRRTEWAEAIKRLSRIHLNRFALPKFALSLPRHRRLRVQGATGADRAAQQAGATPAGSNARY